MQTFFDIAHAITKGESLSLFAVAVPAAIWSVWRWKYLPRALQLLLVITLWVVLWRVGAGVDSGRYYVLAIVLSSMILGAFPLTLASLPKDRVRLMREWVIVVIAVVLFGTCACLVKHTKNGQQAVIVQEISKYVGGANFPAIYDVSTNGTRFAYKLKEEIPDLELLDPTHIAQEEDRLVYSFDKVVFICKDRGDAETLKTRLRKLEPNIAFDDLGNFSWGRTKSLFLLGIDNRSARAWGKPLKNAEKIPVPEQAVCLLDFSKMPITKNGDIAPMSLHMPNCARIQDAEYHISADENGVHALRCRVPESGRIGMQIPLGKANRNRKMKGMLVCRGSRGTIIKIQQYRINRADKKILSCTYPGVFRLQDGETRLYTWEMDAIPENESRWMLLVFSSGSGCVYHLSII